MPKFKITDNQTGKTVTVSGDSAPTEAELEQIFTDAGLRSESQNVSPAGQIQLQSEFRTQAPQKDPNDLLGILRRGFIDPFVETGKVIGGAGFELGRTASSALGNQNAYFDEQGNVVENPFLTMRELEEFRNKPLQSILGQAGRSAQIVSMGVPVGGGGAATAGGRIAQAGLRGGVVGAVRGLTSGDETIVGEKPDLEERLDNTLFGAAVGGVVGAGSQALGEAAKPIFKWSKNFAQETKNRLANRILKLRKGNVYLDFDESGALKPGNRTSNFFIDKLDDGEIKISDYRNMYDQVNQKLADKEKAIQEILAKKAGTGAKLPVSKLTNSLDDLASNAKGGLNSTKAQGIEKIKNDLIAQYGKDGVLNAQDALELRRLIEADKASTLRRLATTDTGLDDISASRVQAQLKVSDQIRNWLRKDNVLGGEVGDLLRDQSGYFSVREVLEEAVQTVQKSTNRQLNSIASLFSPVSNVVNRPEVSGGLLNMLNAPNAVSSTVRGAMPTLSRNASSLPNTGVNPLIQLLTGGR